MAIEHRPSSGRRRANLAFSVGLLQAVFAVAGGCLSPPPSRDSAPGPALPPPPPAPAETAPLPAPAAASPAAAPATEGKASAGEAEESQPGANEARRDRAPSPPRAASKRARSASERSPSDNELGGAGAEPQKPAELRAQLDRAERAATPDCPSARERKKAVCDLAGQICRLTDRDPNVASVAEYCADAKQRCNEAERRTAQSCPD